MPNGTAMLLLRECVYSSLLNLWVLVWCHWSHAWRTTPLWLHVTGSENAPHGRWGVSFGAVVTRGAGLFHTVDILASEQGLAESAIASESVASTSSFIPTNSVVCTECRMHLSWTERKRRKSLLGDFTELSLSLSLSYIYIYWGVCVGGGGITSILTANCCIWCVMPLKMHTVRTDLEPMKKNSRNVM